MNWDVIQSVCFLILAGSIAVSVRVLYRITRDLLGMRTEMRMLLGGSPDGNVTNTPRSVSQPGATVISHGTNALRGGTKAQ